MRDELLAYYERELAFLRQMGGEFSQKYPKIAARLQLDAETCEDPHVERMLEAFAFLAGRVHLKIDDEFPEITESLLNALYPHYLAPVPSMSIVQFALDPGQGKLTTGYEVARETILYSRPIQGTPCRFRTAYPVILWPIEVAGAAFESLEVADTRRRGNAVIRLSLRCANATRLAELQLGEGEHAHLIDSLRFYLNGEPQLVHALYEMIFNQATQVELRPLTARRESARATRALSPITLPATSLRPVGFEADEGLLPYTARSFPGYRLLTEYFAFPDKFLFFDVTGLDQAARAGFGDQFEVLIYLRNATPPRATVDAGIFQLGCAPIVNLFPKIAEPIRLTQQQYEYPVIPDIHRQMATEVYSVDLVMTADPYLKKAREFQSFYALRHAYGGEPGNAFWYATRRPSPRPDDSGTDVYVSLVDLGFNPSVPAVETMTVHTTCTNRDLPAKLPFGGREGDLEVEGVRPLSRVRCLRKPTPTLRAPLGRGAQWRLISHLSLNFLSLVESAQDGAPDALQEILHLYDFVGSSVTRKHITGIKRVSSRPVIRQIRSPMGLSFVRGTESTIEFDEDQFVGSGILLFASVLERFLGLYVSLNSFSRLVAKVTQREGYLKQWPPRAGNQILL